MLTTISNSILSATINHKGAELISLKNHKSNREYIWEGNPEYWGKHSPILFPIIGTLKQNSYQYINTSYALPRHGFARDLDFEVVQQSENHVIFSLKSSSETIKVYPFQFELQVCYTLIENDLIIGYKVMNKNSFDMPFSIGGHPAFALPDEFENYSLQFDADELLTCFELENDLLSEKTRTISLPDGKLPLTYSLFEKDALIIKSMKSTQIQIIENKVPMLNFKFKDFPNFGIWTKKNAPFICLEPWFGYSDRLDSTGDMLHKEGIIVLEQNATFECSYSVEIL